MAATTPMKKRKHDGIQDDHPQKQPKKVKENGNSKDAGLPENISLQIVTGSYDRGILHGITVSIPTHCLDEFTETATANPAKGEDVIFSDSFLFSAHTSSIRCLAISAPSETGKRTLATGGSDERINLYSLSTTASKHSSASSQPIDQPTSSLVPVQSTVNNHKNRSLGNLLHHDRAITRLHFPPNSNKLFSSSEDNNIAITRTRDWTLLSSIRAPIPKPVGRPSGDTAAPGEVPAGINDFAIHPSQKLMLSVSKGEKCLRLWNLMTGKKAGVLNFDKDALTQAGERKYSSGEGRRVLFSEDGETYTVVFEFSAISYDSGSKEKAVIRPDPPTKLHQAKVVRGLAGVELLALSTEDGRILFYDIGSSECVAELGGRNAGISGRVKDFEILPGPQKSTLVVTGSSDGAVRIWKLLPKKEGTLLGTLESGNRITCLGAFVMD